jgi:hypothetical protein
MVFDFIGFIYPEYCFPAWKKEQKRKSALKLLPVPPKQKRVKILANRPKSYYTERAAELPAFSAAESSETKAIESGVVKIMSPKVIDFDFLLQLLTNLLIYLFYFEFSKQRTEEVEKKGVTKTPIQGEVSIVDMEPKVQEQPKVTSTLTWTPRKGKEWPMC